MGDDNDLVVGEKEAECSKKPVSAPDPPADDKRTSLEPAVVDYVWGRALPPQMRRPFNIVACGDLLYHVWKGRLQLEFLSTLQDLYRRRGEGPFEFLFGFQVRSGRQEDQVLESAVQRLGLVQEELLVDNLTGLRKPAAEKGGYAATNGGGSLKSSVPMPCRTGGHALFTEGMKYRLVRLRSPRPDEC